MMHDERLIAIARVHQDVIAAVMSMKMFSQPASIG